jgi:radical SAM protein with 4Fe4S-binding SPASM domain
MSQVTLDNLKRKSSIVDEVTYFNSLPLFSFIDLNVTELCNRKCVFCPRVDPDKYPNQDLKISLDLIQKIAKELKACNFQGIVNICGYGEPLLHKDIAAIVKILSQHGVHAELITNGDRLTEALAMELQQSGLKKLIISLYDGPHQIEHFKALLQKLDPEWYLLRDRWYDENQQFGLILTNRAGVLDAEKPNAHLENPCYYTHYSMTIDWNGDALLCVQDWNKKVKMGNAYGQPLVEIWKSGGFSKYRSQLTKGNRAKLDPCRNCDATGTFHGKNHSDAWHRLKNPLTPSPTPSPQAVL